MNTIIRYAGVIIVMFCMYLPSSGIGNAAQHWMPARVGAVAFSIEGKGYLGTGARYQNSTLIFQKDFWEYDPGSNTWNRKPEFCGDARSGAACFSLNEKGFIATGNTKSNACFQDIWEYNMNKRIWTRKADLGKISLYHKREKNSTEIIPVSHSRKRSVKPMSSMAPGQVTVMNLYQAHP